MTCTARPSTSRSSRYLASGHYPTQVEKACQIHRERRDVMMAAIERHMGDLVSAPRPAGGANVWVTLNKSQDEQQLYRRAVAAGLSFTPGSTILVEPPRSTHLRLSFSFATPARIEEGVRRLALVIRAMQPTVASVTQCRWPESRWETR